MTTAIAFLVSLAACTALPTSNINGRKQDNYDQVMLSPRILPDEMYGPNYVWDSKGMPRKIEYESPARQYYDAPPINEPLNTDFMPFGLQNAMNLMQNFVQPENYKIHFPDSSINHENDWHSTNFEEENDDNIEQRMMLPSGMEIPNEMYGPDYNWDTKGWPSHMEPSSVTVGYPIRNRVQQDRPIYFPGNYYKR